MRKLWVFKNCNTSEVFKNQKYSKILKENVWKFALDRGWKGINDQTYNSNTFSVKFSVFINFASATVFNIDSPNFWHLLAFTYSLHFWNLQSANIRSSVDSRSVRWVYLFQLRPSQLRPCPLEFLRKSAFCPHETSESTR